MRYFETPRQRWHRERRLQRLAAKQSKAAPEEHVISIDIMCQALSSFYYSEEWLALAPFGRWLTFWRRLGQQMETERWGNFFLRALDMPAKFLGFQIGPIIPIPMEIPDGLLFRQEYTYSMHQMVMTGSLSNFVGI
jgi:hypothetical protein